MIKIASVLVIVALATLYKIYKEYEGNRKKALLDIALLLFLLFATIFSKYLRIYTPLLIVHIFLLFVAWGSYYLYLFGFKRELTLIFIPIATISLFFLFGFLDRTFF